MSMRPRHDRWDYREFLKEHSNKHNNRKFSHPQVRKQLDSMDAQLEDITQVDRFEVIDETGRAYVKGSIYGSPVKVELSYQDGGKTLKVFVTERK